MMTENEKEIKSADPKKKKWGFLRNFGIVCLLLIVVSLKFVDYKQLYFRIRLKVLNRLRPESITELVNFAKNPAVNSKNESLDKFRFYYQNVYDLMPDRIDALGLVGYCQYYLGDSEKAVAAYEKAIEINPHFFWFYYNLGTIYFQQKEYDKAIAALGKALTMEPENVMRVISISPRIYMPIIKGSNPSLDEAQILNQMRKGYRNAYLMVVLSSLEKEDYESMLKASLKAIDGKLDGAGDFYFYAGLAFYKMKKPEEAMFFLKRCLEKNPKYAQAIKYLGILSVESGTNELGLKLIAQSNMLEKSKEAYVLNPAKISLQPY